MRKTAIFPLSIWGCFQSIFIRKAKRPPYFYIRFIWPTDLESVPRVEPPTLIISTKFKVDTTIHRRVTALLVRIGYVTLWPWPLTFEHGQCSNMAGHVVNPSTKFVTYELWCPPWATVNNALGSHCACAVSRDLCVWGKFYQIYLKSLTTNCLFTMQPPRLYDQGK